MRVRGPALLGVLMLPLAATFACPAAAAEDDQSRYTGLAVTWHFGGGDKEADRTQADLSFGSMQVSVDTQQSSSVLHLPLVQVPLVQNGQPSLAPVRALAGAVGLLRGRAAGAAKKDHFCATDDCAALEDMLPDPAAR